MTLVIETKQITPKELKVGDIRLELLNALRKEGTEILKMYRRTVATWHHKPKFERKTPSGLRSGYATVIIGTDDEIYGYVDLGTRPHRIVAKNVPYLVFQRNYTAKTTPRIVSSRPGGKSGPIVKTKVVPRHPGNKAREFSLSIQRRREQPFHRAMVAAMKRGAAKANARGQA